jgi:hypothetical protein
MKAIYFDELRTRIRDIRSSERSALAKIADVMAESMDYDKTKMQALLHSIHDMFSLGKNLERFTNYLLLKMEAKANRNAAWVMSDIENLARKFVINIVYYANIDNSCIYRYPCFNGKWVLLHEGDKEETVILPKDLKSYHHNYAVLRVINMDLLIESCSDIKQADRARPYDILAQLDHQIVDGMPGGYFPTHPVILVDNIEKGFGFEFSHFEVDLQEPDPDFRTLYVVYRYSSIHV